MPTLTGTLTDVTGGTIEPEDVLGVSVKAPVARVGAQIVTTRTVPVDVDAGGALSVDLEPGPAVLVVRAESSTDSWDLAVTGDMSQIREAIIQDVGTLPEWDQSVLVQLAKQVREDAEWSDESRAVVAASRDAAAASEQAAAQSEQNAKASEDAAGQYAAGASTSEQNAKASEDAAATSEQNAATSAGAAASSASAADASANAAADSESAAHGHADAAEASSATATTERGTVEQIRDNLQALLADSEAWAGFEAALEQLEPRMAAEVEKLKGDAPEAYDTLGEVAAWIADHEDAAAAIMQEIAARAKTTDVNEALAGKADAGAENTAQWGQISGKPTHFPPDTSGLDVASISGLQAALDGLEPKAWEGTRAQYDALGSYDENRTYYILEDD